MDHTETPQENEELMEFSLDDILNEFGSGQTAEPAEEAPAQIAEDSPVPEAPAEAETAAAYDPEAVPAAEPGYVPEEAYADEADYPQQEDIDSLLADAETQLIEPVDTALEGQIPTDPALTADTRILEDPTLAAVPAADPGAVQQPDLQDDTVSLSDPEALQSSDFETQQMDPRMRLRELKRKLVAGPEKRYYALSELGVGKLQVAVLINVIIVALCAGASLMFYAGQIPENRMRLLIFSQVLAMLISAALSSQAMIDGLADLFKARFSVNTMLALTFLACCVDAAFCLKDQRVPCCAAFSLEATLALCARKQARGTELSQMDTLRKANRLRGLKKAPDFYEGNPGLLRDDGELEDFWNIYEEATGPRKVQNIYAVLSLLLCIAISALAGVLHGPSMAVQILATSLLVAVPASFFVAFTRPAAILERRLHMVGAVLCGWKGVKALSSRLVFPLTDTDLFPQGSTKLNGVKFYGDRDPDMIISYTSSLILAAGGGLVPVFQQLMASRGVAQNPVQNFQDYGNGGIGGEVCGESVLMGTYSFLQSMGVEIPDGSTVNQAVYAAIDGQLCAVVAIAYARMRSAAAGMVTVCGYRRLTPVITGTDFLLTEDYIREKFEITSKRLRFPDPDTRRALNSRQPDPAQPSLALVTREDLATYAYAVTGARALRTSCTLGLWLHLLGGILGMLIMLVLAILGSTELLTPMNVLCYQLVWLVPGLLITGWTRNV